MHTYPYFTATFRAEKARKVVYTAIAGSYDTLEQPRVVRPDYDYVCFIDHAEPGERVGVWQLRSIPYKHEDPTRRARYVKLQPHVVLPEYDYSLWMDANVVIANDYIYRRMDDLIDQEALAAFIAHWERDCIYDEAMECYMIGVDTFSRIWGEVLHLVAHRYPTHKGLIESNVVYRHHSNPRMVKADNLWWKLLNRYSKRDQLSLNYVLWRCHIPYELIFHFNPSLTARNSDAFIYIFHPRKRVTPPGLKQRRRIGRWMRRLLVNPFAPKR